MKELDIKDVKRLLLWLLEVERSNKNILRHRFRFLVGTLGEFFIKKQTVHFAYKGKNAHILLFISDIFKRKDLKEMFDNIASTIADNRYDKIEPIKVNSISFRHWITAVMVAIYVYKKWRSYYTNFWEYLLIVRKMIEILDLKYDADRIVDWRQYRLAVFYYDAKVQCNYFSQYLQTLGVKTATLQHGVMIAKRPEIDNLCDYAGIEFGGFVSDFFLSWNLFTQNEAIKSGISIEKIKVLGNVKCLNVKPLSNVKTGCFGVILDGWDNRENNIPMLKIAQEVSKYYKMKYKVRYHPNFNFDEYNNQIDFSIANVCSRNVTLVDFLKKVEFCILSNSTCLFELHYYGKPYYRYSACSNKDKFRDLNEPYFTDFNSLLDLINNNSYVSDISSLKEKKLYASFFNDFI